MVIVKESDEIGSSSSVPDDLLSHRIDINTIFDNTQELITIIQDGRIKFISGASKVLGGYSEEEVKNMDFLDFIHPDDQEASMERYMRRMSGEDLPGSYRVRLKKRNGDFIWTLLKAVNITWDSKPATLYFLSDLSDTIEAEQELARTQDFNKLVVDTALEAIVIIQDQTPIFFNDKAPDFLGYTSDEFRSSNFLELLHPDERMKVINRYISRMSGGDEPNRDQYRFLRKDGSIKWGEVNTVLIEWKGEKATLNLIEDITERVEAENRLKEEKNKGEFYLDLLGHDINNLMQGISAWVEFARRRSDLDDEMSTYLEKTWSLSERSKRLVRNVLIISKVRDRETELHPIEILPILENTIYEVDRSFPNKKVITELLFDDCDPVILAEPIVEEAFFNIIHNAIKVQSTDNPKVIIKCEDCSDDIVRISVADHGPGIPEELREVIFQRFNDPSGRRLSGIGLSLTKELIDRYNGSISIQDNTKDGEVVGAVFIVELPLAERI